MTVQTSRLRSGQVTWQAPSPALSCAAAALLGAAAIFSATAASAAGAKPAPTKVCSSVKGSTCWNEPSPDTPVPHWAEPSYKVYLDMKAAAHGGTGHTMADMPDWTGFWVRTGGPRFDVNQRGRLSEGHTTADLTPKGRADYLAELKKINAGNEWDPISACLPAGIPRLLAGLFQWNFIDTPKTTWWLYEQQSEQRNIHTDGRGHMPPDEAYPLWDGDTIGFWDGDTLVMHTMYERPSYYQRSQPYYSHKASQVERFRMSAPDQMEDDIVAYDPVNLAHPWHVTQHWRRITSDNNRIDMWSCEENANVAKTAAGGTDILLPGDPGYRSPDKLDLVPNR